ncbi:hypothetical protein QPK87_10535 [Kamptonema cortianum]|nr:hypothetical protein [Geitlerinema splendidum]MDK3157011.1 hypothetical protein [Kamptonema cortianum]
MAESFLKLAQPSVQHVEIFLRSVAGILDASVWPRGETVLARVTVEEGSNICGADLQQACLKQFGKSLTPAMILMEYRRSHLYKKVA